jgi:hypothetical protein
MTTSATDTPSPDLASFIDGLEHDGQIVACEQHRSAIAEVVETLRAGTTLDALPDRLFEPLYAMLECDECHAVFEHVFAASLHATDTSPAETSPIVFSPASESWPTAIENFLAALGRGWHPVMVTWGPDEATSFTAVRRQILLSELSANYPLLLGDAGQASLANVGQSAAIITSHSECARSGDWGNVLDREQEILKSIHVFLGDLFEYDPSVEIAKFRELLHGDAHARDVLSAQPQEEAWLTSYLCSRAISLIGAGSTQSQPVVHLCLADCHGIEQAPSGQGFIRALRQPGQWSPALGQLNAILARALSTRSSRAARPTGRANMRVAP